MSQIPVNEAPNPCLQAFAQRDYTRCIEEAKQSMTGKAKPIEMFLLLLSLQRSNRRSEAADLAVPIIALLGDNPFDQEIVRLIQGKLRSDQILARASSPLERSRATFYCGAKAITEGRSEEAHQHAWALLNLAHGGEVPPCDELLLAPAEFERLVPPSQTWPATDAALAPSSGGWLLGGMPPDDAKKSIGANIIGLLSTLVLFLFFGGIAIGIPLFVSPIDMGGLITLGTGSALAFVFVCHFLAGLFGRRLAFLSWIAIPALFFSLVAVINAVSVDKRLNPLKTQILAGEEGLPEIAPDAELKEAFVKVLDGFSHGGKPTILVRCEERHDTTLSPEALASLEIWKFDQELRRHAIDLRDPNWKPPGADPEFSKRGAHDIAWKLKKAFEPLIRPELLEIKSISADEKSEGQPLIDISAVTRLEEIFDKVKTTPYGGGNLRIGTLIEWRIQIKDAQGNVLCTREITTRPAPNLGWKTHAYAASGTGMYEAMQASMHDNFARELLGRLGLPPGPVKTAIE